MLYGLELNNSATSAWLLKGPKSAVNLRLVGIKLCDCE